MAMTNAERQRLFRQRNKGAAGTKIRTAVTRAIADWNALVNDQDDGCEPITPFTIEDYAAILAGVHLEHSDPRREAFDHVEKSIRQATLAALDLSDPWPDLSSKELSLLVMRACPRRSDHRKAAAHGLDEFLRRDPGTLTLKHKLLAAAARDWLLAPEIAAREKKDKMAAREADRLAQPRD